MKVDTIAVVGSGLMGRGIAYAAVAGGYRTVLHDVSPEALERARQQVRADLDEGRARGKITAGEIVRGLETSAETVRLTEEVARGMRKETVVVRESPGFITSRINAMIGNEAFFMLEEGLASARDIDKALKLGLQHVKAGRLGKKVGRGVYEYARED